MIRVSERAWGLTAKATSLKRSILKGRASPAAFSLASSSGSEKRMLSSAAYQLCSHTAGAPESNAAASKFTWSVLNIVCCVISMHESAEQTHKCLMIQEALSKVCHTPCCRYISTGHCHLQRCKSCQGRTVLCKKEIDMHQMHLAYVCM